LLVGTQKKLHTLHAVLRGRVFDGQFEVPGKVISFNFIPKQPLVKDLRLVIIGRMGFSLPKQPARFIDGVTATLLATQGGVGASPIRRQLLAGTAQTAQTATSDQKLEQEKGPETDLQPGLHSFAAPKYDELGRPRVESTEALSFVGVLYFKLSPIDNNTVGLSLDMSDIQLGVRLAPTDDLARDIQMIFTDIVAGLDDKSTDLVQSSIESLNRAFSF
jgi:hypothetical protein